MSFLLVSLVPLCVVYFYINSRYSKRIEQDAVSMNRLLEENAGIQLTDALTRIEYISNLFFSGSTQEILKQPDDMLSLYNARMQLERMLRINLDLYKNMEQVDQVTFVKKNGVSFDIMNSTTSPAYISFDRLNGLELNSYKNHGIYKQTMMDILPEHKLVYVRRINDISVSTQELGYLFIVFDEEKLGEIFTDLEDVIQTRVKIENDAGQLLYSNSSESVPMSEDWVRWQYTLENFGVTVTFFDEMEKINANVRELDRLTKTVIILSVITIFTVSLVLSKNIVTPVINLRNNLEHVRNGDFKVRVPVDTRDELGDMGQAFNDMAIEIDRLVNQVYTIQLKENEAAIAALQTQINPHFLYNTLDMIKSMADIYDAYEVGDVIVALSGVFRYATHTDNFMVTIQEELANLQNYMKIISTRFGGKINCQLDVTDDLLGEPIIKVCLQPLVENAISHGVARGKGRKISVTMRNIEGDIKIWVRDNGIGISAGRLKEIRENLGCPIRESSNLGPGGVGLKNIHDRIRLYYGNEYGVTIESEEGEGTIVTVCYPSHMRLMMKGEKKSE